MKILRKVEEIKPPIETAAQVTTEAPVSYDHKVIVTDKEAVYAFVSEARVVMIEQEVDGIVTMVQSTVYEDVWKETEPAETHEEFIVLPKYDGSRCEKKELELCHKARKEAYGCWEKQLEMIYDNVGAWREHILSVKKKYPLPSKLNQLLCK